jgi:dipeptidyl aminopeptidase/acylaminoacyl peptidase
MNMLLRFLMIATLLGEVDGAVGQTKRPMTFADLQQMKRVSDPQISPSRKWVMFSVTDVSLEKNSKTNHLWVAPLNPLTAGATAEKAASEVQVTSGSGESNGRFSPDGLSVSWTANDTLGTSQIMIATWNEATGMPGEGKQLTEVSTGADGAIWSPDSKRLLFVSSVYPECSDKPNWQTEETCDKGKDEAAAKSPVKAQVWDHLLYRHWNAFTGDKRSHVLVVDATYGTAIRDLTPRHVVGDAETPTFSLGGPLGYAWSPDSKEIAYVTNLDAVPAASTDNDVYTLRLDETGAQAIQVSTSEGSDDGPAYSPDGKWLAFRSQLRPGYESDRFRLMVFNRAEKTTHEVPSKLDRWVDEFAWAPDSTTLYFTSGESGEEPILKTSLSGLAAGEVLIAAKGGEFGDIRLSKDGATLVATNMTVQSPSAIVSVAAVSVTSGDSTSHDSAIQPISHLNDALLGSLDLPAMESFRFVGAGQISVQGFVIKPPNFDPEKKYPVKFLIHGGPQGAWGDAWSYRWNPELMAATGYVVVMVNPRGSTGYGQAFIDGVNGDWGGKPYVDLMKGLDAAETQFPFIDKTRECALGASYGGYMANWVLTHTNRFKCIVTHDGMFNPAAAYGDTEEMWFNEWEFRRPGDPKPGQPWRYAAGPAALDPFRKWSPMLSIAKAKTPTLVIHSQKDYRLDVSEGFQLFTALQRLGVPSKMLYFPDEGHWVQKPQNSQLWYETVGDWCDRYTKTGRFSPAK